MSDLEFLVLARPEADRKPARTPGFLLGPAIARDGSIVLAGNPVGRVRVLALALARP